VSDIRETPRPRELRYADTPYSRGRVAYTATGLGAPLVLLHPVGLDGSWWERHAVALSGTYRVITVDLPGHGASDPWPDGADGLRDIAKRVLAVLDVESIAQAHLLGVSMGGMVAQHLALDQPDRIASLILCSTTGGFPEALRASLCLRGQEAMHSGMAAVVQTTLERWFSPQGRVGEIGRRCARTLLAADPASWAGSWRAISRHDVLDRLGLLRIPSMVVTGSHDVSTGPTAARTLAHALGTRHLYFVDGACHLGVYEDPAPFESVFARFLQAHASGVDRSAGDRGR
jgi:3-oxoadipate enol-lactonase